MIQVSVPKYSSRIVYLSTLKRVYIHVYADCCYNVITLTCNGLCCMSYMYIPLTRYNINITFLLATLKENVSQ